MIFTIPTHSHWRTIDNGQMNIMVRGQIFEAGHTKGSDVDLKLLNSFAAAKPSFGEVFRKLNGFYAVVADLGDKFVIGVDQIRSIPLFYIQLDDDIYISDNATTLRQKIKHHEFDLGPTKEFLTFGYVLGKNTLYSPIKQVRAGEYVTFHRSKNSYEINHYSYFRFAHAEPKNFSVEIFKKKVDFALTSAIQRLINYAKGREIVLPLSGGYDSRLIACKLKELEYNNVTCFSYGTKQNKESLLSAQIAKSLELPWQFIEYNDKKWRDSWFSNFGFSYQEYASNFSSLPHIQDWLAVKELREKSKVSTSAIFVPGHCCVTGMLSEEILSMPKSSVAIYDELSRHSLYLPGKNSVLMAAGHFQHQFKDWSARQVRTEHDLASIFMEFNWIERQSKYIANSVRVYEFFNYDWWLPLWDIEFCEIWTKVPLEIRINRTWFKNWVEELYATQTNSTTKNMGNSSDRSKLRVSCIKFAKKNLPSFFVNLMARKQKLKEYRNHPLALEGLVLPSQIDHYVTDDHSLLAMYAAQYINNSWGLPIKSDESA